MTYNDNAVNSTVVLRSFQPVPLGTVETIDGIQYRVTDNTQTVLVTYERVM